MAFVVPDPPPLLSAIMEEKIDALHGTRIELLMYKVLTMTDVSRCHNRLRMPGNQLIDRDFLTTDEEEAYLGNNKVMRARMIQPNTEETEVHLARWDYNYRGNKDYVLTREWNQICLANNLAESDVLQIFTFRTPDGELWFCLDRIN